MKKIIAGIMIVLGGVYIGILGASWISGSGVSVNVPFLVGSIVIASIGFSLSGQR